MYSAVKAARRRAVGTRQSMKAAARGAVAAVYVAKDAEEHVVRGLVELCRQKQVPVFYVDSMGELGRACGIKVGAASVAVLKDGDPEQEGGAELADHSSAGAQGA